MTKEELKRQVCSAIANRKADIKAIAEAIWAEPELGYKEHKTAKKVEEAFEKLGVPYKNKLALTGVKGRLLVSLMPLSVLTILQPMKPLALPTAVVIMLK